MISAYLSSLNRRVFCVAVFALLIGSAHPVHAQLEEIDHDQWKNDYHGFALLCRTLDLVIHSDRSEWSNIPVEKRMLICFGNNQISNSEINWFIENGGSMLWASDHPTSFPRSMGIRIQNQIYRTRNQRDAYRGQAELIYADSFSQQHSITRGIDSVVTNLPSVISVTNQRAYGRANWWPLLRLRKSVPNTLLLAGQFGRDSNVVVVADHSIFTNQMLTVEQNSKLVIQTIKWLQQGKRTDALILVDGRVVQPADLMELEVPLPQPTKEQVIDIFKQLDPELMLGFANSVIADVEDSDMHNLWIPVSFESIPSRYYFGTLLVSVTVIFVLVIGRVFVVRRNRAYAATNSTTNVHPTLTNGEGGNIHNPADKSQIRRQQMLERQQVAVLMLQKYFREINVPDALNLKLPDFKTAIGNLDVGSRVSRPSMVKQFSKIWRLANRKPANYWTYKRIRGLKSKIDAWRQLQFGHGLP